MRRPVLHMTAFVVSLFILVVACLPAQAAPAISGLSRTSGTTGTPVTISGSGFGSTQGLSSSVQFGDWRNNVSPVVAQVTNWSNTSIGVVVPTFLTGVSYFEVVVSGAASNRVVFVLSNPLTSGLMPSMGPTGSAVTIWGTNFGLSPGTSTVTFAGNTVQPTNWSNNSIVILVPSNANSGANSVAVTVGGLTTNTQTFTVSTKPFISNLSVNSAPLGEEVAINGENFGSSQGTVTFNGTPAIANSWSETLITASVPAGATTGNIIVTVGGVASNGMAFMVTPPPQEGGVGFVQGNYSVLAQGSSLNTQCYQESSGYLTSTFEVPFPVEQNSGDLNLAILSWRDTNADLQVLADSGINQYWVTEEQEQSGNGQQWGYYASGIASGPNSIYVEFTSSHGCVTAPEVLIAEYRGLSTTGFSALDVSVTKSSSGSATCNSGSATTTNRNDVLIGVNLAGETTSAAGTNYTNRLIIEPSGDILEDRIVTATGSYGDC